MEGLRRNGVEIFECHSSFLTGKYQWLIPFNYVNLAVKFWILKIQFGFDAVIVGFSMVGSFIDVFLARLLTGKTLIFNPLVSLYETLVTDRKMIKNSLLAKILHYMEKISYVLSDIIMTDTNQHTDYISGSFGIDRNKFRRVFIGAETSIFHPKPQKDCGNPFIILFYGSFIPLHGVDCIVKSAKILEQAKDIRFVIVGRGQTRNHVRSLAQELGASNVLFIDWVKHENLPTLIGEADVCLGIFGGTEKSMNVIPYKVFEILAMKKPLITGHSPAIEEIFTDRKNLILCEMADPKSLASYIVLLKQNPEMRTRIAQEGYKLFLEHFTLEKIGREILETCFNGVD